jgi:hypothetical protein
MLLTIAFLGNLNPTVNCPAHSPPADHCACQSAYLERKNHDHSTKSRISAAFLNPYADQSAISSPPHPSAMRPVKDRAVATAPCGEHVPFWHQPRCMYCS